MKRIIVLILGVATGLWMLRDLRSVTEPTASYPSAATTLSNSSPAKLAPPRQMAPPAAPGPDELVPQGHLGGADNARNVKAVKYSVLVQGESSTTDTEEPELTATPETISASDRAELGRWATSLLGSLVPRHVVVAKSVTTTVVQEAGQPSDSAKPQVENVAQRDPSVAPPAAQAPVAKSVVATEKPADMEKPAVTAAATEDTLVTDEKPAATEPKSHDPITSSVPAPAAAIPPIDLTISASNTATDAKPLDTAPSAAVGAPNATSPAALPAAALPQTVAPALVPVAPVRPPLTPELVALSQKVHYALAMYQHQRLLNTGTNACWEVMHRLVAYGAATEVLRNGPGGEPVNAIGWLLWGGRCNSQPLLVLSNGRPMAMVGVGVQGHSGQFLGMLAQSRVRPESPFELQGQRFTVRDLIEQEKLGCEANTELTFELIAMSYYLKSDDVWTARSGEQWSISRLVQEEIKQPIQGAACGGSHRLFGLSSAYKLRIAEGKPVDGEFLRAQRYIRAYQSYALGTIHNRDGSFSTDWFRRPADNGNLDRKIQTTGHILEWLVFSLDDNQLRDPRVVQSVDFLATQIARYPNRAWSVGPLGHALHAMAIYELRVSVQPSPQPKQQQTASAQASDQSEPTQAAPKATFTSLPPQPKADPARPAVRPLMTRPTIGTPNAAAATAELEGPDLGVTR